MGSCIGSILPQGVPAPAPAAPKAEPRAKVEKAPAKVEQPVSAEAASGRDGEPADRLPSSVAEPKESRSGFVTFLFLSGRGEEEIAGELNTAFKVGEAQAVKVVRRITGQARLFQCDFSLVRAK